MSSKSLPIVDANKPWYHAGLHFTCTQCGNCCTGGPGYVWITKEEIVRIAQHLQITPQQMVERYCRKINGQFSLTEIRRGDQYDCVFLKDKKIKYRPQGADKEIQTTIRVCSVYDVRPLQCRTFPFWKGALHSREAWQATGERCPGINQGRKFTQEQIERIRDSADWPENPPDSSRE